MEKERSETATAIVTLTASTEPEANQVVFGSTPPSQTPQGAEMRQRLSDPVERAKVRAGHLEYLRNFYPEAAQVLGLDAEREAKFFEVLTDQQMVHLEHFYTGDLSPQRLLSKDGRSVMQEQADEENRKKQEIRKAIGDESFARYADYMDGLTERQQIVYFEKRLEPADKLTSDQKERLTVLLRDKRDTEMARRRSESHSRLPAAFDFSQRQMKMLEVNAQANQDHYLEMLEDTRALLAQLPAVLTPKQLEAYTQMETAKLESQKKFVRQMRTSAGMSPDFDETKPRVLAPARKPVSGKIRLELQLTVDANSPVKAERIVENGKATDAIQGPEGLWFEATPTLYEDGWAHIEMQVYEERRGKRVRLQGGMSSGSLRRLPDGRLFPSAGAVGTVDAGHKVFVITSNTTMTPVE